MDRRKTVMLQIAGIILGAVLLAVIIIFISTSGDKSSSRETEGAETAAQTKEQAKAEEKVEAEEKAEAPEKEEGSSEDETKAREDGAGISEDETEAPEDAAKAGEESGAKEPADGVYTFSFAGDCTIGSLIEWQGNEPGDFQSVVGTNYSYPLSGVKEIFSADDLTMVNLEGTFTTASAAVEKPYRFRADPAYVQVLTEGSVEAVSTANNHSGDFMEAGLSQTRETLENAGVRYTGAGVPMIMELPGGLKLGLVSCNTVDNPQGITACRNSVYMDIETCKEAQCDLIIGFMHWGSVEYLQEPEDWEVQFAYDMVSWGCDMIVGGHAHILQRMELYNDVPVFFSMGNFCYGGHLNPPDKDSVIVQAQFKKDPDTGEVSRCGLRVIPCLISSRTDANDYCPTPCEEDSEDWQRIIGRLRWTPGMGGWE